MAEDIDLAALKARVSGKLMAIDGVSGVGIGSERVNIYLALDDHTVRNAVAKVMQEEGADAPFEVIASGPFSARKAPTE